MKILAERIKELRTERGLSPRALAKKPDVSKSIISYWESDKVAITDVNIVKLADFFGVSCDYLPGRTEY